MRTSKWTFIPLAIGVLLSSRFSPAAAAAFVNGSIGFNGTGSATSTGTAGSVVFDSMNVDIHIGDFRPIASGTAVNLAPISWTGSGNNVFLTSNNNPEWQIASAGSLYQYSILALANASVNVAQGAVSLSGYGVAWVVGAVFRDPTYITFSVQGTNGFLTFTLVQSCNFNCGPSGPAVPESGSTILLLGIGVTSLVLRKHRSRVPTLA